MSQATWWDDIRDDRTPSLQALVEFTRHRSASVCSCISRVSEQAIAASAMPRTSIAPASSMPRSAGVQRWQWDQFVTGVDRVDSDCFHYLCLPVCERVREQSLTSHSTDNRRISPLFASLNIYTCSKCSIGYRNSLCLEKLQTCAVIEQTFNWYFQQFHESRIDIVYRLHRDICIWISPSHAYWNKQCYSFYCSLFWWYLMQFHSYPFFVSYFYFPHF